MAFTSHGAVAAKMRKAKDAHPERYCRHATCLWRTSDDAGNPTPCPRHGTSAAAHPQHSTSPTEVASS